VTTAKPIASTAKNRPTVTAAPIREGERGTRDRARPWRRFRRSK
jgi:hypothetical protein